MEDSTPDPFDRLRSSCTSLCSPRGSSWVGLCTLLDPSDVVPGLDLGRGVLGLAGSVLDLGGGVDCSDLITGLGPSPVRGLVLSPFSGPIPCVTSGIGDLGP